MTTFLFALVVAVALGSCARLQVLSWPAAAVIACSLAVAAVGGLLAISARYPREGAFWLAAGIGLITSLTLNIIAIKIGARIAAAADR